jgi:hypothetical protein
MYPFGQIDAEIETLKRELIEGRVLQKEFDEKMRNLQRRKAEEEEWFKKHPPETYGDDGFLWA